MSLLAYIVIFSIAGGILSLAGGMGMLYSKKLMKKHMHGLTSFAAGVLISVSVLDLLPEAFSMAHGSVVGLAVLLGILFLYVLEKSSVWFHHHHEPHGAQPEIIGVFLGDTLHNFVDGLAIGAAFLVGVPQGIATAIAVGLHELPQEIADFSLYIRAGIKKKRTIMLNVISSLATLLGAVIVYFFGEAIDGYEVYILAATAGMFLYIALADLVPEIHEEDLREKDHARLSLWVFFLGIILTYASITGLETLVGGHSTQSSDQGEYKEEIREIEQRLIEN